MISGAISLLAFVDVYKSYPGPHEMIIKPDAWLANYSRVCGWEELRIAHSGLQVYVVGEVGIQEELDLKSFTHIGGPEDGDKKIQLSKGYMLPHDPEVGRIILPLSRSK